eukprot:TRINITY_DN10094_c0_g1_i1.p1 TRINITY_DN10094_c0_g1~~TRINITY_DN10094_c0_g1_i1.p1  ORF type:complete len:707 (-),score=176.30 TRINITY_DN10094_c0_g1_i1:390-2510(-)
MLCGPLASPKSVLMRRKPGPSRVKCVWCSVTHGHRCSDHQCAVRRKLNGIGSNTLLEHCRILKKADMGPALREALLSGGEEGVARLAQDYVMRTSMSPHHQSRAMPSNTITTTTTGTTVQGSGNGSDKYRNLFSIQTPSKGMPLSETDTNSPRSVRDRCVWCDLNQHLVCSETGCEFRRALGGIGSSEVYRMCKTLFARYPTQLRSAILKGDEGVRALWTQEAQRLDADFVNQYRRNQQQQQQQHQEQEQEQKEYVPATATSNTTSPTDTLAYAAAHVDALPSSEPVPSTSATSIHFARSQAPLHVEIPGVTSGEPKKISARDHDAAAILTNLFERARVKPETPGTSSSSSSNHSSIPATPSMWDDARPALLRPIRREAHRVTAAHADVARVAATAAYQGKPWSPPRASAARSRAMALVVRAADSIGHSPLCYPPTTAGEDSEVTEEYEGGHHHSSTTGTVVFGDDAMPAAPVKKASKKRTRYSVSSEEDSTEREATRVVKKARKSSASAKGKKGGRSHASSKSSSSPFTTPARRQQGVKRSRSNSNSAAAATAASGEGRLMKKRSLSSDSLDATMVSVSLFNIAPKMWLFCACRECTSIILDRPPNQTSPYCSNRCQTREQNIRQGRVNASRRDFTSAKVEAAQGIKDEVIAAERATPTLISRIEGVLRESLVAHGFSATPPKPGAFSKSPRARGGRRNKTATVR